MRFSGSTFLFAVLLTSFSIPASAQVSPAGNLEDAQGPTSLPEVYRDISHDTSAPAYTYTNATPMASVQRRIRPIEHRRVPGALPTEPDRLMQSLAIRNVAAPIGKNFDGLSDASNGSSLLSVPSDNNIAVGATQVVET